MKTLMVLILGIAIGLGGFWYYHYHYQKSPPATLEKSEAVERSDRTLDRQGEWRAEEIREELEQSGGVIRRKAREMGAYVSDATADVRITTTIKSKLAVDDELSALAISVNTTDGVVTLSGRVTAHEHIGRAIDLATNIDGVREVISTLQVSKSQGSR
jgi:hyperosmotically inducible periplasmic protein